MLYVSNFVRWAESWRPPPSPEMWETPHPHEKRPKYLVHNPRKILRHVRPRKPRIKPIFLCFIASIAPTALFKDLLSPKQLVFNEELPVFNGWAENRAEI